MKKVGWRDVQIASGSACGCRFGPFDSAAAVAALSDGVLFGADTVPLSSSQKCAIRALLSRRSVLYSSTRPDRDAVVLDLMSRAREWRQTIVYCAPTLRAAEAMYTAMCTLAGGEKSVCLDVGHDSISPDASCLVITVPRVLRRAVVDMESHWWMTASDVVVLDDLLMPGVPEWEEIILGMPSRVLLCLFATELTADDLDELPLWLETVQNSIVPIAPRGSERFAERVDRPIDAPLARAFVFNAARHRHPVQVSLPLVVEELRKDFAATSGPRAAHRRSPSVKAGKRAAAHSAVLNVDDIVAAGGGDFESALLRGVQVLSADDVAAMSFENPSHALYADVAALVVADARETAARADAKVGRPGKRVKKSSAARAAAARRRQTREGALLLPALVLVQGREASASAAGAALSCLDDASIGLACDPDVADTLASVLSEFARLHGGQMTDEDKLLVASLGKGIGVIHGGVLPTLRSLAEELFRGGLVQVLCVDSRLGSRELTGLPRARSVLVQSSALAEQSDDAKGLVKGSLLGNLAGRPGLDDVGNVVALWYDEEVDDAEASVELASALFANDFALQEATVSSASPASSRVDSRLDPPRPSPLSSTGARLNGRLARRRSGGFLTTYPGVLGTLRRHGYEGYTSLIDYALDSYRGWLVGAGMRATREKVEVEKRAVDDHLTCVDWEELASHDRLEAKLNENVRLYRAMEARKGSVLVERVCEALRSSGSGALIGLRSPRERRLPPSDDGVGGAGPGSAALESPDALRAPFVGGRDASPPPSMVPAVFVSMLDNRSGRTQPSAVKGDRLVVCVTVDGMWTLVSICDVLAVSGDAPPVPNVDLIPVPHLAAFDLDPVAQWAKCRPISESEVARVNAVCEELLSCLTASGDALAGLAPLPLVEFDKQLARVTSAQESYDASPWRGREAEATDLRRLRRRALELGDDASRLRSLEAKLDASLQELRSNLDARLRGKLAVLEDCNAVSVPVTGSLEMTPIGVLASVLPGPYPLFAAACLLLVSALNEMSPAQVAAFVLILVVEPMPSRVMPGFGQGSDGNMFDSIVDADDDVGYPDRTDVGNVYGDEEVVDTREGLSGPHVDDLAGVLPDVVLDDMERVRSALLVVQHRHFNTDALMKASPRIAPPRIETRGARAAHNFVGGQCSWAEAVEGQGMAEGDLARCFRSCAEALRVISVEGAALGELSDVQAAAASAVDALCVWPVSDAADLLLLAKSGVCADGSRHKFSSYRGWWDRAAGDVASANADADVVFEVEAEVVGGDGDTV